MALPAGRYGVTKRQLNKIKNLPVNTIGMIEEAIETSEEYTDDAIGWDNTNLMPLVPYNINSSSGTIGESTFTDTSGHVSFIAPLKYKNTDYTLSNVGGNRFRIILSNDFPAVGGACNVIFSDLNARSHSFNSGNYNYVTFYCSYDGQSPDVIKPQLELGTTATPYKPHHATVDVSKCDNSVIAPVEDQTTCQNPDGYTVGKHFIRNGAFCTVIQAISSGGTLTENTNYVEGAVGDFICMNYHKSVTIQNTQIDIQVPQITNYKPVMVTPTAVGSGTWANFEAFPYLDALRNIRSVVIRNKDSANTYTWDVNLFVIYAKNNTVVETELS